MEVFRDPHPQHGPDEWKAHNVEVSDFLPHTIINTIIHREFLILTGTQRVSCWTIMCANERSHCG